MPNADPRLSEGRDLYPNADDQVLIRIAQKADELARETEAEGQAAGVTFSAGQSEYGCDWHWGPKMYATPADIDEDDGPCARVYDCDGETIEVVTDQG